MFNLNKKLTFVALLAMTSIGSWIVNISSISAQIQPPESSTEAVTTTTSYGNSNINPQLKPGADEKLYLVSPAKGVQIYQCQSKRQVKTYPKYQSYKYKWIFEAPEADLYDRRGSKIRQTLWWPNLGRK
jgi:hypothetical protein